MANNLGRPLLPSAAVAALFTVSVCCSVNSQPLIYNTNKGPFGVIANVHLSQWVAAPFLTGPSAARLDSVTLYEYTLGGLTGSFGVSIYNDSGGKPGSMLSGGGLNGPSTPHGAGFLTYTAGQPLTLAPSTHYWVVASSDTPSVSDSYGWAWAASPGYISFASWQYYTNSFDFSRDQGSSWGIQNTGSLGPLALAINGAVIPEPSTLVFVCLVCAVALLRHVNTTAPSRSNSSLASSQSPRPSQPWAASRCI